MSFAEDIQELRDQLIEINQDNYRDYDWLNIRCPVCGDSEDNPDSRHLWIKLLPEADDEPIMLKCYKPGCKLNTATALTSGVMVNDLHIMDKRLVDFVINHNNKYATNFKDVLINDVDIPQTYFDLPKAEYKLMYKVKEYYALRTGRKLINDIKPFRLIGSVEQYYDNLDKSNIPDKKLRILRFLISKEKRGTNYIGFVTEKKDLVSFRDIAKKDYTNISLLNNKSKPSSYVLEHKYVLKYPHVKHTIVLGEGQFDIINAFTQLDLRATYIALRSIEALKGMVWRLTKDYYNLDFVILAESDIQTKHYKKIFLPLKSRINTGMGCHVTLYRNKLAKDIGDLRDGIDIMMERII